jgi:pyruvate/2-oxoglutarate dehydrogenase complex dihydrolipoamide acyltransferase (E2) component
MKRFVKLVAVALLVAVVISRWRQIKEISRQASSGRTEEPVAGGPVSQEPGPASQPVAGAGEATQRVDEEAPAEAGEPKSMVRATPAALRTAEELGVDLLQVEGTGSGGRITAKDVRSAAEKR